MKPTFKIVITGATGLLGSALVRSLQIANYEVIGLSRNADQLKSLPEANRYSWNAVEDAFPIEALRGAYAVVHLAGDPVAEGRWTHEKKQRIEQSRVDGTRALVEAIRKLGEHERPKILISGSAIGLYGDQTDHPNEARGLDESGEIGSDFLAQVTAAWEREAQHAESLISKLILLRTGIVLDQEGGALPKLPPVTLGDGSQWMSWIHIDDWVSFVLQAIENKFESGAYNLTAPSPVTAKDFTHQLVKAAKYPIELSSPTTPVKLALGEMSQVVLASQKVLPKRALDAGFRFRFETLASALNDLFQNRTYLDQSLRVLQFVPVERTKVFPFFSAAENLEKITPPFLNFRIVDKSTPQIEEGTLIDYRLKVHGVPVKWRTQILNWVPNEKFVDTQLKGPYQKWVHTHSFYSVPGGTLLEDHIVYRIPAGVMGKVLLSHFISNDVKKIFAYRTKVIEETFGGEKSR